jgi:DnaA family protein
MAESAQILLDLDPRRPDRFEDFVPGPNSAAVAAVRRLLDEPGQCLFLQGPRGSGKSHLLNALCHEARHRGLAAYCLALKHVPAGAARGLSGLDGFDLVCIDDIDSVAGQEDWEHALFKCFNDIRSASGRLLVSSTEPLARLQFGLPDLASRLAWGVRQSLKQPGEPDRLGILRRRAASLQIDVPDEVFAYLLRHGRRDTASLLGHLEQLRAEAFAAKRRITVPLARTVLGKEDRRKSC